MGSKKIKSLLAAEASTMFPYIFLFMYALSACLVSLHRFWQYEVFYDSFGIFDSVIWQASRFQMPLIDHVALGRTPVFADHFYPTIFLLSPLFWIIQRSEMLLVVQALAVTLSGWFLFDIGKKITKNAWISFGIMASYLLFVGLQNAIIADFHEITIATLPLVLVFWAIATNRKKLFYLAFILSLGCKESMFLTGVGIGIFLLLQRQWQKTGIITILLSLIWGYIAIKLIIPSFSQGVYLYSPALPQNPLAWITRLFDDPLKRQTLWYSFQSFLFLPIFAPAMWPLLIQDFVTRFIPEGRWTLGMHYNAQTAVLLGVSSLYGIKNITNILIQAARRITKSGSKLLRYFCLLLWLSLIFNTLYLHQRVLHGPLGLSYNPAFYRHTKDFKFLDDLVNQIPKDKSVMTQGNLIVRFSHQKFYMLDINYDMLKPDYILLDLRDGQNPNNFFGMHGKSMPMLLDKLTNDPSYEQLFTNGNQHIWKRK